MAEEHYSHMAEVTPYTNGLMLLAGFSLAGAVIQHPAWWIVVAILFSIAMKLQYWANNKDKAEKEKASNYLAEAGKIML
jgi:hypothetical protein